VSLTNQTLGSTATGISMVVRPTGWTMTSWPG
jgi:hypothetical protein